MSDVEASQEAVKEGISRAVGGMEQVPYAGMQCEGCCPRGYVFTYPKTGWDNLHLWEALKGSHQARAMLPIIPGVFR